MTRLMILFAIVTAHSDAQPDAQIHTVLPFDAIPAIFTPRFLPANEADVHDQSPMIGVSIGSEQHAYSMVLLNAHEIVNDKIGGQDIASTW